MKKGTYILALMVIFAFISCDKKEEKKKEEVTTEQVQDTTQTKPVKKEVKKEPELVFTVQVGAFKRTNATLNKLSDVKVFEENGLNKYRVKTFESYSAAKNYRSSILKTYPDAFIQALKNGKPIPIKEALK